MFCLRHNVGYRRWLDKLIPTSGGESVDIRAQSGRELAAVASRQPADTPALAVYAIKL